MFQQKDVTHKISDKFLQLLYLYVLNLLATHQADRNVFMKSIKYLLALLIICFAVDTFAQFVELNKTFEIHSSNSKEDLKKYYDAASLDGGHEDGNFDMYRFYDKRRKIEFTGSEAYIELYSAKELNEKYGKPISPLTIQEGQPYQNITFVVNLDGKGLKPQLKD